MRKIAITGANGFIGQKLKDFWTEKGFEVKGISRLALCGDPEQLVSELEGADAVVHLAGAPIMQRWTRKNRRIIYNSRVVTTWNLTKAINSLERKPQVLLSVSAIAIYTPGLVHDERSFRFSEEFAGRLVSDWENASIDLDRSIRRIIFRTGVVLGKESQVIRRLVPLFRLGLGGRMGSGRQAFPFIHVDDLLRAFNEALINIDYSGVYNLVAPDQVTNGDFIRILAQKLHKPAFFHVPKSAVRLALGKASVMLLENPFVIPGRLTKQNFGFNYPDLSSALTEIVGKNFVNKSIEQGKS